MKGKKSIWSRVKKSFLGQEMVDLCSAPPPRSLNTGLYRGGGQPLDRKNFDLHPPLPPPPVVSSARGGKRYFWALKSGFLAHFGPSWVLFCLFWTEKTGVFWVFLGRNWVFFPRGQQRSTNAQQTLNKRSTSAQQTLNKRSTNAQQTLNKRSTNAQQTHNKRSTHSAQQTLNKRSTNAQQTLNKPSTNAQQTLKR